MPDLTDKTLPPQDAFRCIAIIIDSGIRSRLSEFLSDAGIPIYYQMHGVGTVSSEFLNLCGFGDPHKNIVLCFVRSGQVRLFLAELNQALQLHKKGTGIAVSIPVGSMQGWLYKLSQSSPSDDMAQDMEKEGKKMSDTAAHAMILVTMKHGYSGDVMSTARAAGATGGTVLKGLICSPGDASSRFGLPLQEEQEILAIVVPGEKKKAIMTAISSAHGISTPAHAVAVSLPVDALTGL